MIQDLKRIGDYFPYCLTIVDVTNKGERPCLYANKMFFENTGYSQNESVGRNLSFLQGELTSNSTVRFMRDSFIKKKACVQDIINYKKSGIPFMNRLLMLPMTDRSSSKVFYIGIQNDITQMKGLEHNSKSLRTIKSAEVQHMVNNPLAAILGTFEHLFINNSSDEEMKLTAKKLASTFKRINDYALNVEKVSDFANFTLPNNEH
jgi:PAS domain S-box-containing protein